MSIYAPDYYKDFRCIADKCVHTCCTLWEIDIDDETLARYESMPGEIGERIRAAIVYEDTPHFALTGKGGTCPLLTENGLCSVVLECGEDALCQICTDHPRFRNFWTGRVEIGVGMCCEAAAKLILTREKPMEIVCIEQDDEEEELPEDEAWLMSVRESLLEQVGGEGPECRLAEYLIWRHIADALYDDCLEERIAFVQWALNAILDEWQDDSIDTLAELCRQFSAEVEYDTEVKEKYICNPDRVWKREWP